MFNITDCNFALQSGPSSAPPNPQTNVPNHFSFTDYFTQPFTFYNQLNHQLSNYASIPSPATINNLTNSFQQQQFNSPTGFTTPATTPGQAPAPQTHYFQQPSTSIQSYYPATNDHLSNFQQNWTQQPTWPPNLTTQSAVSPFYDYSNGLFTSNDVLQQLINSELPQPSVTTNPFWIPKDALDKTVVLLQKQNPYTLAWSEKTSKMYFRKWFDTTFNINVGTLDKCKIIHKPDFLIAFIAFDANTTKYLVNVFADGQLRNDVLLKSASDFLIQSMSIHKQRQGSSTAINNVEEAVNVLSETKQANLLPIQQPMSAPPYMYSNPFGQSS